MPNSASGALFPNGLWHGHFFEDGCPEERVSSECSLEFRGNAFKGRGEDSGACFSIEGQVDSSGGHLHWQKRYDAKGVALLGYVGAWDPERREITGRWRAFNTPSHGRFVMRPGPAPSSASEIALSCEADSEALPQDRWQSRCAVDLEAIRFDGEREMLDALLADPDFVEAVELRGSGPAPEARDFAQGSLTHGRIRLSRAMLPSLFAVVDRCVRALGLTARLELYCDNNGVMNAGVAKGKGDEIRIYLTSAAINALDDDELAYVIGHELGHALLGHLDVQVLTDSILSGLSRLRRLALSRYQELSADRMGLMCCPDVAKAVRGAFILESGIVRRDALGRAEVLVEAAREAVARASSDVLDQDAAYDTHPYGPMRTASLDLFARSKTFHELRKIKGGELSEAELEAQVTTIVRVMNPTVLEQSAASTDIRDFVALAALSVAQSSDGASKKELTAIKKLGEGMGEALARATALSAEEQQVGIVELAEQLKLALAPHKLGRILEDLVVVAVADGKVSDEERWAIEGIAVLLELDGFELDAVLAEMREGLD
jgi:tellurite resistance protein